MKKHALFILIPLIALTSCNQIHDKLKISNFIYYIPNFARISFPFFD